MPHDKDGRELAVGDVVHVPARVTALQPGDEYCNASLETEEVMYPGQHRSSLTLNTKQVIKALFAPAAAGIVLVLLLGCPVEFASAGEMRALHGSALKACELKVCEQHVFQIQEHEQWQAAQSQRLYVVQGEACAACATAAHSQQFVQERVRLGERAIVGKPLRAAGRVAKGAAGKLRGVAARPAKAATKALGKAGAWLFRRCTR